MDFSNLQPILNLLNQQNTNTDLNQTNNFNASNNLEQNSKFENKINISSYYPAYNLDGSSCFNNKKESINDTNQNTHFYNSIQDINNTKTNNLFQNNTSGNPLQNFISALSNNQNLLKGQSNLINLLTTLAPNLNKNSASSMLSGLQNFLKPKKEETAKTSSNIDDANTNKTNIEDLKNVNDIDIE